MKSNDQLVHEFKRLFNHLPRKYGIQNSNGEYLTQSSDLTINILESCLTGDITIDLKGEETNCFCCFDIDIKSEFLKENGLPRSSTYMDKALAVAVQISSNLSILEINHFCETSGRRGLHTWLFFSSLVAQEKLATLMKYILENVDISNEIEVECKPKHQGDGIRFPFSIHKKTGHRNDLLNDHFKPFEGNTYDFLKAKKVNDSLEVEILLEELALKAEVNKSKKSHMDSDYDINALRSCIAFGSCFKKLGERNNLSHSERKLFAMTIMPLRSVKLESQIHEYFEKQPNYDPNKTIQNLTALTMDYPLGCRSIQQKLKLCDRNCSEIECYKLKSPSQFLLNVDNTTNMLDLPNGYSLPDGYSMFKGGINKYEKGEKGKVKAHNISYTPFYFSNQTVSLDDDQIGLEMTYYPTRKKQKKILVSMSQLAEAGRITGLSNYGLDFTTLNCKKIIAFAKDTYHMNKDSIPTKFIAGVSGWYKYEKNLLFILGDLIVKPDSLKNIEFEFSPTNEDSMVIKRSVKAKGSIGSWLDAVRPLLKYRNIALALGATFGGPLLKILGVQNHILHFLVESTKGKTFLLQVCASIFGYPAQSTDRDSLIKQWRGTDNGIENKAYAHNNFVLLLDEAGQLDAKTLSKMIYMLANGAVKSRARSDGESRAQRNFSLFVISTGEVSLLSSKQTTGKEIRCHEITTPPFAEEDDDKGQFVDMIKEKLLDSYGHAGAAYLQGLVDIVNNQNGLEGLKMNFQSKLNELSPHKVNSFHGRNAQPYAIMWLGMEMADSILNLFEDKNKIKSHFINLYKEAGEKWKSDITTIEKAIRYIWDEIDAKEARFQEESFDKLGIITNCQGMRGSHALFETKLDDLLTEKSFDPKPIKKQLRDKKYIVLDKDGQLPQVRTSGKKKRMYVFHKDLVEHIYHRDSKSNEMEALMVEARKGGILHDYSDI